MMAMALPVMLFSGRYTRIFPPTAPFGWKVGEQRVADSHFFGEGLVRPDAIALRPALARRAFVLPSNH